MWATMAVAKEASLSQNNLPFFLSHISKSDKFQFQTGRPVYLQTEVVIEVTMTGESDMTLEAHDGPARTL